MESELYVVFVGRCLNLSHNLTRLKLIHTRDKPSLSRQ